MHNNSLSHLAVKVCGMKQAENIAQVAALNPDYMGFIFWEGSKRYAGNLAPDVVKALPYGITRVGVFVNQNIDEITTTAQRYGITHIQLHGDENPQFCKELQSQGFRIFKAISIGSSDDLNGIERYAPFVDMFVFDTKSNGCRGGSGKIFDHSLLTNYSLPVPFLLSGGIGPENADIVKDYNFPSMIGLDINSRFELDLGLKDPELLKIFINKIRK